jgi:hypothetical protein
LVLAGIGGLTAAAWADDDNASISQVHVGHRCVERSTTASGYYYGSSIENNSTTESIVVYCPVDNAVNVVLYGNPGAETVTHTTNLTHEWSATVDDNSAGNVSCYLRACSPDESTCDTGTSDTASTNGVEVLTGSTDVVGSWDVLMLRCELPQKSGSNRSEIISYTVESF